MTGGDERTLLLLRLRSATGGCPCAPAPPAGGDAPEPIAAEERAARFAEAFEAAGGLLFSGPAESVLHDLGETLRAEGVAALFSPEGDEAARRVAESLAPFGPFTLASCAEVREGGGAAAATAAGFRTAEAGIAETGTVIETSADGKSHLPGLLPRVHVSLLSAASLHANLEDALAALGADPPRNVTFCSGPSRTADIEQVFAPGVFGPAKTIVLLID